MIYDVVSEERGYRKHVTTIDMARFYRSLVKDECQQEDISGYNPAYYRDN